MRRSRGSETTIEHRRILAPVSYSLRGSGVSGSGSLVGCYATRKRKRKKMSIKLLVVSGGM
jgi:hypothetical protein